RGQQRARDDLLHRVARQLAVARAALALLAAEAMALAVGAVEDRLRQPALELAVARLETDRDDRLRTARGGALGFAGHRPAIAAARAEAHVPRLGRSRLDRQHEPVRRRNSADTAVARWDRSRRTHGKINAPSAPTATDTIVAAMLESDCVGGSTCDSWRFPPR